MFKMIRHLINGFPLFLSIMLFSFSCQPNEGDHPFETIISDHKTQFAPDKRVAIFNISIENATSNTVTLIGETNLPNAQDALLKSFSEKGITVDNQIESLPASNLGDKHYGVVNVSVCNIRSVPKHSGELSTQSLLGTPLKVYKKEGDWYYIQTPDQYLGWLDAGALILQTKEEQENWLSKPKVIVIETNSVAFAAPQMKGLPVSDLSTGNLLVLEEQGEEETSVSFPDGRIGYVSNRIVSGLAEWLNTRNSSAEAIISTAKTYLGRPYLWGGTSSRGIDCSGYTKMVFYMNGLLLPRDASQQVHTGIEVETDTSLKNLLPGDLLYFGRKATAAQKERITHVAIYLGDGEIIHSTGMVKIQSLKRESPLFAAERLNTFVRAKRPLQNPEEYGIPYLRDLEAYKTD